MPPPPQRVQYSRFYNQKIQSGPDKVHIRVRHKRTKLLPECAYCAQTFLGVHYWDNVKRWVFDLRHHPRIDSLKACLGCNFLVHAGCSWPCSKEDFLDDTLGG